ncbi:MAG: ABC transporter ATP-binding protein [Deltaproteobacteria bacterium]|nr:ABC transporter ATP-binding protein [Deltaproteobacteria bacterium]
MTPALHIQDLRIEYRLKDDVKVAVERLSLTIEHGELFALLGPNGAGKTSMISAMVSLIPFQGGEIKIFDHPAGTVAAKKCIGLVPQELVSYGFFTVNEILQFVSGYYGILNNQKRIDYLLERLQLQSQKNKLVSQLSGGMKRRMLIAKALVHSPKILLLDEPSAGVDVELRTILWDFVKELNASGMTIILTTHYLEEAQRLCKRTAIMDHGKLLAMDYTDKIIADEKNLEEAFLKLVKKRGPNA